MKKNYRICSAFLALVLCLGLCPVSLAAETGGQYGMIAGGVSHSLAVKNDGSVWGWGSNSAKQVDPSSDEDSVSRPTKVKKVTSAVSVACGSDFSAALLSDGTITVWGGGADFATVPGLTGVADLSVGQSTLVALKSNGTVWQWTFGSSAPEQVPGLERISSVAAGGGHYLALGLTGEVWAWGNNNRGQLGTGSTSTQVNTPEKVSGLTDVISIAAGYSHSLAARFDGQVYAWGSNTSGQLGNGSTNDSNIPRTAVDISKAVQVSAGNESSMAMTSDGKIYTWGYGEYGQLGLSTTPNSVTKPGEIKNSSFGTPLLIASGMNHNLLLNNRGSVYTWGRNRDAQLGTGKNENGSAPQSINLSLATKGSYSPTYYTINVQDELSSWAREDLTKLYQTGLIPPSSWERYNQNITRAEFAHLAVSVYEKVKGTSLTASTRARFADIKDHPMEQSILKAYQLRLLSGYSDTVFAPDEKITRQEVATLLCKLVNKLEDTRIPTTSSVSYYSDASQIASWAVPYVAFAHSHNIMLGSDGRFNPSGFTTREQALAIMARLANRYDWA
ncbi:MAG: hypothetical protein HFF45_03560 [Lawsonibacter sp.]|nr:hypothetical protein [Lawsonibacter sp.]